MYPSGGLFRYTAGIVGRRWLFGGVLRCYLQPMTKIELHRLVDALPDESLPAAAILLRRAQDPVVAKLDAAPVDDEELTDEDRRAISESREEPGIAWSEVEAELNAG